MNPYLLHLVRDFWHYGVLALGLVLSILASGQAILYKRDSRSAIAWVGFIWLVPLVGAVMYFLFGVNRLRRKAAFLRKDMERYRSEAGHPVCSPDDLRVHLPHNTGHLNILARVVEGVVNQPLLPGNKLEPLVNGDEAYPAMLEAIRQARKSISFVTYIFDRDDVGLEFARAFGDAVRRGVEVRLLIDAAGTRYSFPTILHSLRKEGVNCARFMPSFALQNVLWMNLRTHRKIMVVDGCLGFTGGMNIRLGNCLQRHPPHPVQDLHFRVNGPMVTQMQEVFADDWLFTTNESLRGENWFPKVEPSGPVLARGIVEGPDENYEKLRWTLLAAISIARRSVRIVTPYFLPDTALISALNLAAMRGVEVDIIMPAKNNLPFVMWASRTLWWQVLKHGCRIWLTTPPFDHSKLMLVDECWTMLGSANWDPRSLRLNFEFNVETYDADLAKRMEHWVQLKLKSAHQVTLAEVDARSLPSRLRDGIARLLTPYL